MSLRRISVDSLGVLLIQNLFILNIVRHREKRMGLDNWTILCYRIRVEIYLWLWIVWWLKVRIKVSTIEQLSFLTTREFLDISIRMIYLSDETLKRYYDCYRHSSIQMSSGSYVQLTGRKAINYNYNDYR